MRARDDHDYDDDDYDIESVSSRCDTRASLRSPTRHRIAIVLLMPLLIALVALWWLAFIRSKSVSAQARNIVILLFANVIMVVVDAITTRSRRKQRTRSKQPDASTSSDNASDSDDENSSVRSRDVELCSLLVK